MPTPPSVPGPAHPTPASHEYRQLAESFGVDAERYDRTRPRYPDALIARIVAASPGQDVLDVGCGTGIAARQFQAAGCQVLGVEPDERMAVLARRLGTPAEVTTFEAWDPAGRLFDTVTAGQAWHWVDPVAGAAQAARVLRRGGLLAPLWNAQQLPVEVGEVIAQACERVLPNAPFDFRAAMARGAEAYRLLTDKAVQGIREAGGFGEPELWHQDWEQPYTRDEWLELMPTQGAFTRLPPDLMSAVLESTGAAVDALGGGFTAHYRTVAVVARRTD